MNMLDELLITLSTVCNYLLPILGAALLIYLIIFFRKLVATMTKLDAVVLDLTQKMTKLDEPLNTVVRLSATVDNIHTASIKGTNAFIDFVIANFSNIVEWVKESIAKRTGDKSVDLYGNSETGKGE